jgi:hypothetical protein
MNKLTAKFIGSFFLLLTFGCLGRGLAAAEPAGPVTAEVPSADLKELNDPTILTRRVWFETEWNKFIDGTHVVEETLGSLWAWRLSESQDWAVRLKLPVKFRVGSDVPGFSDIGGLGDVKLATGTAFRLSKTWRLGGGVDLAMPTGRHELSDNAWRIQEFAVVAWDITPCLTFSPSFEYNQSISEEGNASQIHFLESFFPLTCILPHKWALIVGYENKIDFHNDNYVTHRAKLGIAKELESVPLSLALSAKRDFDSGEKEFQVNFAVTYFFR